MTFFLPDIALTEEQRNRQPESGSQSRPMSFSFENGQGEAEEVDSSASEGEKSVNPRHLYHVPTLFNSDDEAMADIDDVDDDQYSPVPRPKQSVRSIIPMVWSLATMFSRAERLFILPLMSFADLYFTI
jgi:hypothetical protein